MVADCGILQYSGGGSYGIMSLDIIPRRNEVKCASVGHGGSMCETET